jgi:hypothetical protein
MEAHYMLRCTNPKCNGTRWTTETPKFAAHSCECCEARMIIAGIELRET